MAFEIEYEKNLLNLCEEIISGTYCLRPSTCFISFHPVIREVFAADFRDRVVHHLVYSYINPYFEKLFIADSYSCRPGKGTSYGIRRLGHFIRSCSQNYTRDCYILKLDIRGYFMAIDRALLYRKIESALGRFRDEMRFDEELVMRLLRLIIFSDPTKDCIVRGSRHDWRHLPRTKSLFHAAQGKGLPIGNLTSQLFGNVYLNDFDHFVKQKLRCRFYGRYVDDFVIVHENREYLRSLVPSIRDELMTTLSLELHPDKIYLQHYTKGVRFLGTVIKPHRTYVHSRTKNGFFGAIDRWNTIFAKNGGAFSPEESECFTACMNSYLGMLRHYSTYKLRRKMLMKVLDPRLRCRSKIAPDYTKISLP
ncbi:hypothetical protein AUJ46_06380 [Candidatus Peregrinibacteria bacterium CG1_02_54_53]|nr:MAG: hypothetical protein AUJ46_06380 [Candidatus Peregrinibacteria bacterium CG1_02_54_53]